MAIYEIPLASNNQKFNIQLGKSVYRLQLIYRDSLWLLDIMTTSGTYLIAAIPLVAGDNLLAQYQHILKGSMYVSNTNQDELQKFTDLGTKIRLFWSDN